MLTRIAWALLGFAAACVVAGLAILLTTGESGEGGAFPVLSAITFSLVGALVAAGRPRNPVGWLLLTIGVTGAIGLPASVLYDWDRQHAGTFTGAAFNAWLGGALWLLWIGFLVPRVMLLFPNGKLPSRRWRVVSISQFVERHTGGQDGGCDDWDWDDGNNRRCGRHGRQHCNWFS